MEEVVKEQEDGHRVGAANIWTLKSENDQLESSEDHDMDPTGEELLEMSSEPGTAEKIPPPTNCFVCCNLTGRKLRSGERSQLDLDGYSFFLTELLEIPLIQSIKYLNHLGKPASWISICRSCQILIIQGTKIKVQISQLKVQAEQCQRRILEKMQQTITIPRVEVDKSEQHNCGRVLTLIEIQDYVSAKQYSVLNQKHKSSDKLGHQKEQKISTITCQTDCDIQSIEDLDAVASPICYDDTSITSASHVDDVGHDCDSHEISDPPTQTSAIVAAPPIEFPCMEESIRYKRAPRKRNRQDQTKQKRRRLAQGTSKTSTSYLYDCPNCPQIKGYSMAKFMQHLAIHQRRPYKCTVCLEVYPADEQRQEEHWREQHPTVDDPVDGNKFVKIKFHAGEIWKCEICLKGFFSEDDRDQHEPNCVSQTQLTKRRKAVDSKIKPFSCHTCQVSFRHFAELRFHRGLHHPDVDRMSCYYCDSYFGEKTVEGVEARNEKKMMDHLRREHAGQGFGAARIFLECSACGMVFDTEEMYKRHFHQKHGILPTKSLSCVICQKTYCNVLERRKHMTLRHFHSQAGVCDVCGKNFVKKTYLAHHKLLYHGIEPEDFPVLSCSEEGCSYRAVSTEALSSHIHRIHKVGDTPTQICSYCGKRFKDLKTRKDHEEIHINKETRPYQCDICGNSFAVWKYLYIHKRLSHEGRNFPCNMKKKQAASSTGGRRGQKAKKS